MSPYRTTLVALSSVLALAYFGCSSSDGGGGGGGNGGSANGAGNGGTSGTGTGASSGNGGTGNIISTDGGGTGGSGATDGGCTSATAIGELVPANLLFLIDRSGSMNCNLPSDGQSTAQCEAQPIPLIDPNTSKWILTRNALKQAISDLQTAPNVSAGLTMFPVDGTDCGVQQTPNILVQQLDATQNTNLDNFLDTVTPKGNTPLAGATILSYAYLLDQLSKSNLQGNKFVVLLTDGFETCKPDEIPKLLGKDVPDAYGLLGIRTFVIGVPGSEDGRALLSQIAYEGGTAKSSTCVHNASPADVGDCHFDMTTSQNFGQDLKDALTAISGAALACEIDVPAPPPGKKIDFDQIGVQLNGGDITKDDSVACDQGANGWQLTSDKKKILLCGSACDDAKKPNAELKVVLGCLQDIR